MGSQFVDLNGDGHSDYLTSIFDGSPHVSWGSEEGFSEPELLYDAGKERILVAYYWDYDEESHLTTGRAMPDGKAASIRGISALAFDWDADGDFDLLQGTYEEGRLFLQLNEGTNHEPRFTGKNQPVLAGTSPPTTSRAPWAMLLLTCSCRVSRWALDTIGPSWVLPSFGSPMRICSNCVAYASTNAS